MNTNDFHATPSLAIAYHSGFGHTRTLAGAVAEGASAGGAGVDVIAVDAMTDADWAPLDRRRRHHLRQRHLHGQRVGGISGLRREDGRRCLNGTWRDKIAAGFTNSGPRAVTSRPP